MISYEESLVEFLLSTFGVFLFSGGVVAVVWNWRKIRDCCCPKRPIPTPVPEP